MSGERVPARATAPSARRDAEGRRPREAGRRRARQPRRAQASPSSPGTTTTTTCRARTPTVTLSLDGLPAEERHGEAAALPHRRRRTATPTPRGRSWARRRRRRRRSTRQLEAASQLATLDGAPATLDVDGRPRDAADHAAAAGGVARRASSGDMRWRIAILVSAAIAISYLDRQTLPVAIKAIERDIPISNEQFSSLQSAFLIAYALMYVGGGKLMDVLGTRAGFLAHHGVLVARLRQPRAGDQRRHARRQPPAARHGRGRRLSGRDARRRRVVPRRTSARRRWASSTPARRSAPWSRRRCIALVTHATCRTGARCSSSPARRRPGLGRLVVAARTTRPNGIRGCPTTSGDCWRR